MPGGIDDNFYTPADVEVFSVLVSQTQYAAWWGVMLAAAVAAYRIRPADAARGRHR